MEEVKSSSRSLIRESANYKFKQKYGKYFGWAVVISLVFHVVFILGMPSLNADIQTRDDSTLEAVDLPPEVVIPPPPKQLSKPSIPMEASEEIEDDVTIEETTPPPPDLIPEVPMQQETAAPAEEFLTVAEVMPKVKSQPPMPKMPSYIARARVNVETRVEFYVAKTGDVDPGRTRIAVSSGYPELDELALEYAKKIKFHPALNRGEPVAVRMAIPIKWISK